MKNNDLSIFDDGEYYDSHTGNVYLMPMKDKIKYYEMLTKITIPNVKPYKIIKLKFHQDKDMIIFNGLAGYIEEKGGFSIKGFIELKKNYIGLSYALCNDNNYKYVGYFIDKLENKGRVK